MYGLPKIHKENAPIRPIISAIGTYNYKLAKYMVEILTPLTNNTHTIKDTFDFVNKVTNIDHNIDRYMVSFDVVSLFTNIPTVETIEIILDEAFKEKVEYFNNLNREELKKLLIICTQKSHFQFNGNYYEQIDGVAMGSPLGPLFASFFMSSFERKHMPVLKTMGIIKWLRYVDDIFATMSDKHAAERALNYLNAQHPNIKFTIEHEEKNRLPFLDTLVGRHKDRYTTSVYHKRTYTSLYLN